jgi:hypothetical protein
LTVSAMEKKKPTVKTLINAIGLLLLQLPLLPQMEDANKSAELLLLELLLLPELLMYAPQ